MERRLAALLMADVVGYSRLMEDDESGTLAALTERRASILAPTVIAHGERVVKLMGDGMLIEFGSAINAVAAAVDVQREMAAANALASEKQRIDLRIGINLGDVIGQETDVFGEGVNIAARLEALADPGGICVSGKIHDEVRNKVACQFEEMGEQKLKNISTPVRAFRLMDADPLQSSPAQQPRTLRSSHTPPSLAVLPFTNMSSDLEQRYFSDGLTEDIITELARFRDLHVIARNSSFPYRGGDIDIVRVGRELIADGSGWRGVYDELTQHGYRVTIVQNPLTSLEDDVASTKRVLDRQDGPTVLVGHFWAGTVIAEAGVNPKVAGWSTFLRFRQMPGRQLVSSTKVLHLPPGLLSKPPIMASAL
ncbi:adenylate cyclase [Mesorhizobium sp. L2C066B000]|nr:adenylate cyclase [Mesorhizobium sp. L2C066B000]